MREAKKSSIKRLVEYITDEKGNEVRVGEIRYTNLGTSSIKAAINLMQATQSKNFKSKCDKTYHLMLSFPAGENPKLEIIHEMENKMCKALGFTEHQRISVIHKDTDNLHIHIAINKINPDTYVAVNPFNDYLTIQRTCEQLEKEYGLQITNHTPKKTLAQNKAQDIEHHTGIETFLGWMERNFIAENIREAQSWQDLHERLAADGIILKKQGNGLNFVALKENIAVKASSLGREFSKGNLEKRLGEFEPFKLANVFNYGEGFDFKAEREVKKEDVINKEKENKTTKAYFKRPVFSKIDTKELFEKYKQDKQHRYTEKIKSITYLKDHKKQEIETVWREFKAQKHSRHILKKPITYQQAKELIKEINYRYKHQLKDVYAKNKSMSWFEYLQRQAWDGNNYALQILRTRFDPYEKQLLKNRNIFTSANLNTLGNNEFSNKERLTTNNFNSYKNQQDNSSANNYKSNLDNSNFDENTNDPTQYYLAQRAGKPLIRYSVDYQKHKPDLITKNGTAIYAKNGVIIRETANFVIVDNTNQTAKQFNTNNNKTYKFVLDLASSKFGNELDVIGNNEFKSAIVYTKVKNNLTINFNDEKLNQEIIKRQQAFVKERKKNEQINRWYKAGEYAVRAFKLNSSTTTINTRKLTKPYNFVHEMPNISMVSREQNTNMLLHRNASSNLANQQSKSNNHLRRNEESTSTTVGDIKPKEYQDLNEQIFAQIRKRNKKLEAERLVKQQPIANNSNLDKEAEKELSPNHVNSEQQLTPQQTLQQQKMANVYALLNRDLDDLAKTSKVEIAENDAKSAQIQETITKEQETITTKQEVLAKDNDEDIWRRTEQRSKQLEERMRNLGIKLPGELEQEKQANLTNQNTGELEPITDIQTNITKDQITTEKPKSVSKTPEQVKELWLQREKELGLTLPINTPKQEKNYELER